MKSSLIVAASALFATTAIADTGITPILDLKRGTSVTVIGTVERIPDEDEFILSDETGSVEIYMGPNFVPVSLGETVTVQGFVDNDPGPLEIYAQRLTQNKD